MLYKALFPNDEDPNHANYGYFVGKNKNSFYKLKALINESPLNPLLIKDDDNCNAFFVKVLQSEVDNFLEIVNELKFREVKLSSRSLNDIKYLFEIDTKYSSRKVASF